MQGLEVHHVLSFKRMGVSEHTSGPRNSHFNSDNNEHLLELGSL